MIYWFIISPHTILNPTKNRKLPNIQGYYAQIYYLFFYSPSSLPPFWEWKCRTFKNAIKALEPSTTLLQTSAFWNTCHCSRKKSQNYSTCWLKFTHPNLDVLKGEGQVSLLVIWSHSFLWDTWDKVASGSACVCFVAVGEAAERAAPPEGDSVRRAGTKHLSPP